MFPDQPSSGDTLEAQQAALLQQQEHSLRALRQQSRSCHAFAKSVIEAFWYQHGLPHTRIHLIHYLAWFFSLSVKTTKGVNLQKPKHPSRWRGNDSFQCGSTPYSQYCCFSHWWGIVNMLPLITHIYHVSLVQRPADFARPVACKAQRHIPSASLWGESSLQGK